MVALFLFKQKTAYEIEYGLVGSEMCIRDSFDGGARHLVGVQAATGTQGGGQVGGGNALALHQRCLLYTSDAADERSSVDLGGRRIIKKKKMKHDVVVRVIKDLWCK